MRISSPRNSYTLCLALFLRIVTCIALPSSSPGQVLSQLMTMYADRTRNIGTLLSGQRKITGKGKPSEPAHVGKRFSKTKSR